MKKICKKVLVSAKDFILYVMDWFSDAFLSLGKAYFITFGVCFGILASIDLIINDSYFNNLFTTFCSLWK